MTDDAETPAPTVAVVRGSAALLARRRVEASGLTPASARRMRLEAVPPERLRRRCADLPAYERAMIIPYWTLDGAPSGFWRARYLAQPRPHLNGHDRFAAESGPPEWTADLRYVQPPGTLAELYLPPLLPKGTTWQRIARDPDTPLVITEGEMKAAKATQEGLPTVGLGGVWMFKSGRQRHPLLPDFYRFEWKARRVYLIYDSDASTNLDVHRAAAELARYLTALGAVPFVLFLPHVARTGDKTGLDDYLLAESTEELSRLLQSTEPYAPAAALYELNAEVVYVRHPGLVVVLADGRKLSAGAFKEHAFANRHYHEEKFGKGTTQLVRKPAAPAWLQWERRFELERITYAPGQPRITPAGEYNYWPGWGVAPRRGDLGPWRELLDFLFDGQPRSREWFERWCAWPLQHPGDKMYSAAVLWGTDHGTGKSLVGYTLGRIYGRNFTEIKTRDLGASHNEWAENKQLVMGDDITSGRRGTVLATADTLKNMITQRELRLNPKFVPAYTVPDVINYYFTSNHPDAFFLEDTDRRYFVHHVNSKPLPRSFYQRYDEWLWRADGTGPAALFYHLLHLSLGDFDAHGPALMTEAKRQMQEAGLSDAGIWVRRLRDAPDALLRLGDAPLAGDLWTNEELLHLYDPEHRKDLTANGLGRELTRAGIPQACGGRPIRVLDGQQARLYALRRPDHWATATQAEASRHYHESRSVPKVDQRKRRF